jgi:multidrug resistance efflux pump
MRYQLIPVLVFLCGIYTTVFLWGMHMELPNGIGAVKALRIDIVSPVDGILVSLPGAKKPLDMFDSVKANELVCKFDDKAVAATIYTLEAEVKELGAQLLATDAQMKLDFADRQGDKSDRRQALLDDARRIAVDLERVKLDVADRTIQLEANRIGLKRRAEKLDIVKDLVAKKLETPYVLSDTKLRHDVLAKEVVEQEKALIEAKALAVKAQGRMDAYAKMVREEDALREARGEKESYAETIQKQIDIFLKPIEAAIATQKARINEAVLQRESLEIRVDPALVSSSGTIMEVYRRPGQAVRAGELIMRIANPDSMYIVSYVRQPHRVNLEENTPVGVQVRTVPIRGADTYIARVGPQIESVPTRQLRDPKIPEWGLPVKISVPKELKLTPGELVNITYKAAP